MPSALLLLLVAASASATMQPAGQSANQSPIRRVVTLIEEMKAQVSKEGEADTEAYDKYACWCETNDREKTAAIATAEERIDSLSSAIEEYAAQITTLKTEIEALDKDLEEAQKSLETAAAQREKEKAEFEAQEVDMKEALSALSQAVDVLSKVQLMQKQKLGQAHEEEVGAALLQVQHVVMRSSLKHYRDVMQSDLWDFLSSTSSKKQLSTLALRGKQPIEGGGAVPGAKSYNSRSGQIFGILSEMRDEFGRDLSEAQTAEATALIAFQKLKAAKQEEIDAATKLRDQKASTLADATQANAQAKQDLEDTKVALAADQEFLLTLKKDCKVADEEYKARAKVRGDELVALAETIKILTNEESRDLFGKTMSFLQTGAAGSMSARLAMQTQARARAVKRILAAAKASKNWQLATLAVSAQLDAFDKVKEAMNKMMAEMQQQQKDEYAKWEFCKKEIDSNEDATKTKTWEKKDLEDKNQELENTISRLTEEIEQLKAEMSDMQVSLKRAGEGRKKENQNFQAQVADQRAMVQILNKALARLNMFYGEKKQEQTQAVLAQVAAHQEPGAAVAPPPPKSEDYSKSAGSGGVTQLLNMIIEDAQRDEQELTMDEQKAQEAYAGFVVETNSCMAACEKSMTEKEEEKSTAQGDKSETEAALSQVNAELVSLKDLNLGLHTDCDFLLENFEIRQKARKEEMDGIVEAMAILSGANFGL